MTDLSQPAAEAVNSPDLEADVLDVWSETFPAFCAECKLTLPKSLPAEAETSEAGAARFVLALLRESRWLRWRFPAALSSGAQSKFCRWLCRHGARKFNLSEQDVGALDAVTEGPDQHAQEREQKAQANALPRFRIGNGLDLPGDVREILVLLFLPRS